MSIGWTEERTELAVKLWAEGLSASQIARKIGDVTRNAVIGKIHRLGLSGRARHTRSASPYQRKPRRAPRARCRKNDGAPRSIPKHVCRPSPEPSPERQPTDVARVSFAELEKHHCQFPCGDPKSEDFGFCGHKRVPGLPYCAHHAQRTMPGIECTYHLYKIDASSASETWARHTEVDPDFETLELV